ncbi:oligosaccharide flippase family protein [Roseateles sp. BYS180W]|uniref:Oligosaccharide flippase family protein n=1 Tax=Roseateles rivi TaxID=3299028 RepID=A0ABW7FSI0_9BURK
MKSADTLRAKKGLKSIVISKPLSAFAGLATLFLLSRYVDKVEYAAYFAVWASVEIILIISQFGLMHIGYRYIRSEVQADGRIVIDGPVRETVVLRTFSLFSVGVVFFVVFGATVFSEFSSIGPLYLSAAVVVAASLEGVLRHCELLLDSMMNQLAAQISMLIRTLTRPFGFFLCYAFGHLSIQTILIVELVGLLASCAYLMYVYRSLMPDLVRRVAYQKSEIVEMVKFAMPGYLAQLVGLLSGADMIKVVLSSANQSQAVAEFGFALSLALMVQRYLPIFVFGGVIRPVFVRVGGGETSGGYGLWSLVGLVSKLNVLLCGSILVFFAAFGVGFVGFVSDGNFVNSYLAIYVLLLGVLVLGYQATISAYGVAVNDTLPVFWGSIAAALVMPVFVYVVLNLGAVGAALAWLAGLVASTVVAMYVLRRTFGVGFAAVAKFVAVPMVPVVLSLVVAAFSGVPVVGTYVAIIGPIFWVGYLIFGRFFSAADLDYMKQVVRAK